MSAIEFIGTTYRAAFVFIVITSVLLIFPILRYVRVGWKCKSEDITHSIDNPAKVIYLEKFQKFHADNLNEANQAFFRLYHQRFGRRHFIFPTLLIAIILHRTHFFY